MKLIDKKITRKAIEIACRFASYINLIIRKNRKCIVFYESTPGFMNNYVLLQYLISHNYDSKYKIWYFPDIRKEAQLDEQKYHNVKFCSSLFTAFRLFLTTKFIFIDTGNMRIRPTNKQCVVYMDHGLPFKLDGLLSKEWNRKNSVPRDLIMPVNYFLSTSPNFDVMNCNTFNLKPNQLLRCGRPRTDALYKTDLCLEKIGIDKSKYKKTVMWMTTWRITKNLRSLSTMDKNWSETNLPILTDMDKINEINTYLKEKNYLLVIKIHQSSVFDENSIQELTNVKLLQDKDFVCKGIQIYDLLKDFDLLVTDYSSVFLDFSITMKPVIFITDDIEDFAKLQGFYFDKPKEFMPGVKVNNYSELIEAFDSIEITDKEYYQRRKNLKDFCHYYQDGKDTERLIKLLEI